MPEDVEQVTEAPEATTVAEDSRPEETLAQGSPEPEIEGQPEETPEQKPTFDPNSEHEIEFNGKKYVVKGGELQGILENTSKLSEKEKSLNRDYTQKTQQLAAQWKSIDEAFGRRPEPQELQGLGKLYQAYFADEKVAKVIDAILTGQPLDSVIGDANQGKVSKDPTFNALEQEIRGLKAQLSQFVSSSEQEKHSAVQQEGKRIFDTWMKSKQDQGKNVPEEIIDAVLETAGLLRKRNPDWDASKALDEALRRETIDQMTQDTTKKVLAKADSAKKSSPIRITPKVAAKSEGSYADIFRNAI